MENDALGLVGFDDLGFDHSDPTTDQVALDGLGDLEIIEKPVEEPKDVAEPTEPVVAELEIVPAKNDMSDSYRSLVKKILGNIDTLDEENEDGTVTSVSVDELEFDEDTVIGILQSQIEEIRAEANKDRVSVAGLNEVSRHMVDILAKGGNIQELLNIQTSYVDPLSRLDLSVENDQKEAIRIKFGASGNYTEREVEILIKGYVAEGVLEEEAVKSFDAIQEAVKITAERKAQEEQEKLAAIETKMKEHRKNLSSSIKNQFELSEPTVKKLVDAATKKGEDGRYPIDALYNEWRHDPEKSAKLQMMLMYPEEYEKQLTNKKVAEAKLTTSKNLKFSRGSTTTSIKNPLNQDKNMVSFDDL